MRRRVLYVVAWAVATAMTVGASWLGIRSVLVAAVPAHVSPLSAADLRRVVPTTAPPSPSPSPTPTESPAAGNQQPKPPFPEVWAPVPDGQGGTAYKRTFGTVGGDVVVWAAKGEVKILDSTAKPGFTVNVARAAPDSVTVTFTAPRRVSRVIARWVNGPYAEVGEVAGHAM